MNDTDRAFYELAMAEAETFLAAGNFASPPLAVADADRARLTQAWADPAFFQAATAELVTAGPAVVKPSLDPNRKLVPTPSDLMGLPRKARVAFAARCARRVFPVFKLVHGLPDKNWNALNSAIRTIENLAGGDGNANANAAADIVRVVAYAAADIARDVSEAIRDDADAGYAAADAARAAAYVARGTTYDDAIRDDAANAANAASASLRCLQKVVTVGTVGHLTSIARDFDRLQRLAKRENWTDETPVPPSVFGPMWEDPPPAWWNDDLPTDLGEYPGEVTEKSESLTS